VDADAVEIRVLGCLIEKQRTTPDVYPLSLNALRAACNQSTNRDPVVSYDEPTIRAALERLGRKRWTRLASGAGSRAIKYRHLLDETLRLSDPELAVLAVLMLRGPQTPGELKQRAERMHRLESLDAVERVLETLIERDLVSRLPRRPGQKEERYAQLLGGDETAAPEPTPELEAAPWSETGLAVTAAPSAEGVADDRVDELETRVASLEDEVALLREGLASLQRELGV
jgi:uncharacterized protein YceH (UPF0502 family)